MRVPVSGDDAIYNNTAHAINQYGIISGFIQANHYVYRPLYPIFLALTYFIFGQNYIWPIIIQGVLSIIIVFIIYHVAEKNFGEHCARIASIVMILFPSLWAYSGILMREVLTVFFVALLILFLYKIQDNPKIKNFFYLGVLLGLMTLLNSITKFLIYFIVIFLVYYLIKKIKINKKILFYNILMMFLVSQVFTFGWNYVIKYHIGNAGVIADTPELFLMERYERMQEIKGNFPMYFLAYSLGDFFAYKYYPNYNKNTLRLGHNSRKQYYELLKTTPAKKVNEQFLKNALTGILHHPILYLEATLFEFQKFNTPLNPITSIQPLFAKTHNNIPDFLKALIILIIRILHYFFISLIIYAIIKKRKEFKKIVWLALLIIYFQCFYIFIYAIARYSLPLYPLYIILLSVAIDEIFKRKNLFKTQSSI